MAMRIMMRTRLTTTNITLGEHGTGIFEQSGGTVNALDVRMGGGSAAGSASWDGTVLVLKTKRESQVGAIIQNERASLAPDGRTLTFEVDINIQDRDVKMKLVFEKQ